MVCRMCTRMNESPPGCTSAKSISISHKLVSNWLKSKVNTWSIFEPRENHFTHMKKWWIHWNWPWHPKHLYSFRYNSMTNTLVYFSYHVLLFCTHEFIYAFAMDVSQYTQQTNKANAKANEQSEQRKEKKRTSISTKCNVHFLSHPFLPFVCAIKTRKQRKNLLIRPISFHSCMMAWFDWVYASANEVCYHTSIYSFAAFESFRSMFSSAQSFYYSVVRSFVRRCRLRRL